MRRRLAQPPELIDAGAVILRRNRAPDAAAVAKAVGESLEHLEPWMPWARPEAATAQPRPPVSSRSKPAGNGGPTSFTSCARPAPAPTPWSGSSAFTGASGRGPSRSGTGPMSTTSGRGYMTAAAKAVTEATEALHDVDRVEIHTDEANVRSAAIPPKLGYRLDRVDIRLPEAPGESGRLQIWARPARLSARRPGPAMRCEATYIVHDGPLRTVRRTSCLSCERNGWVLDGSNWVKNRAVRSSSGAHPEGRAVRPAPAELALPAEHLAGRGIGDHREAQPEADPIEGGLGEQAPTKVLQVGAPRRAGCGPCRPPFGATSRRAPSSRPPPRNIRAKRW